MNLAQRDRAIREIRRLQIRTNFTLSDLNTFDNDTLTDLLFDFRMWDNILKKAR
jgi:hypothetical protein